MQIIVHIGQQKTASTAIQTHLAHNRQHLATQGILHPSAFGKWKTRISPLLSGGDTKLSPASRRAIISAFREETDGDYKSVLLSEENIFGSSRNKILSLKNLFEEYATSWRILCYIRRPDDHIVSQYQQKMRKVDGRSHRPFEEFFSRRLYDDYYRYAEQMDRWARAFGKEAVDVRVFHRKILQGGPVEDFTRWIGVDPETLSFESGEFVNESLDRAGTEILRFLYRCEQECPELIRGRDLVAVRRKLRALSSNDRLRLDDERAERLQARFRRDHERLAASYLSPDQAEILLAPPAAAPPQPPLDPAAVFERMMAVFDDPALASLAVEEAISPKVSHHLWLRRRVWASARIVRRLGDRLGLR